MTSSVGLALGIEVRAALPPPMGRPVRAFLILKAGNLMIDRFTEGGRPPL